jgi:predicted RNase H-like HicB family nuclease
MQKLLLHNLIEKEGDIYSAICLELNVASQGETVAEAKKNLQEAVELYLEDVIESGDEQDFIPRPAPMEEWIKFFEAEAKSIISKLSAIDISEGIQFEETVYAK